MPIYVSRFLSILSDYVVVDPNLWFSFPFELWLLSGMLLPWSYLCEMSTVQLQHLWLRWQHQGRWRASFLSKYISSACQLQGTP